MENKYDAVIGIDPDAIRHGVAIYINGKLCELKMMNTPELIIDFIPSIQDTHRIKLSIEDVCANKFVYGRNKKATKAAESRVAMNIGHVQQAQTELIRWLDRYLIAYELHKPQSGNWADKRELFERITGWKGQSNADTRAAAYFGYLAL